MELGRSSIEKGFDGSRAYGICQLYYTRNKEFINSKDFQDPYKQMDKCIEKWDSAMKTGTIEKMFQAYPHRQKQEKNITIIEIPGQIKKM
ncbi:hypothetical protein EOM39_04475 [Candidatus Gracilibacteria bacterium]|nr:hypothetical protein [Candidatus Gracilibacteria bacterium]